MQNDSTAYILWHLRDFHLIANLFTCSLCPWCVWVMVCLSYLKKNYDKCITTSKRNNMDLVIFLRLTNAMITSSLFKQSFNLAKASQHSGILPRNWCIFIARVALNILLEWRYAMSFYLWNTEGIFVLHVPYWSIDDYDYRSGQVVASQLSICMKKWLRRIMPTKPTLRSFKRKTRKV